MYSYALRERFNAGQVEICTPMLTKMLTRVCTSMKLCTCGVFFSTNDSFLPTIVDRYLRHRKIVLYGSTEARMHARALCLFHHTTVQKIVTSPVITCNQKTVSTAPEHSILRGRVGIVQKRPGETQVRTKSGSILTRLCHADSSCQGDGSPQKQKPARCSRGSCFWGGTW